MLIDPVAFSIGPFSVHWYALAYIFSLMICVNILIQLNKKRQIFKNNEQILDFAFWIFLIGVFGGGRLGYILFYNLPFYLENPLKIFAVWEGGMSFHGGMIVSVIVALLLAKKNKMDLFKTADLLIVSASFATVLTRIANFINGELYGRVIESSQWEWLGVDFGDGLLRYPSQLFQSAGALIFFLIMLFIYTRNPKKGVTLFSYFAVYGVIRIILEFWREPDAQIGFLFGGITMGQLLSVLMVLVGVVGVGVMGRRKKLT